MCAVHKLPPGKAIGAGDPWKRPGPEPVDVKCISCGAHRQLPGPLGNIDVPRLRCSSCGRRKLKVNGYKVRGKGGHLRYPFNQQQPYEQITDAKLPNRMTKPHQRAEQRRIKLVGDAKPFRQGVDQYPVLHPASPIAQDERRMEQIQRPRFEASCAKSERDEIQRARRWRKSLNRKSRTFIGECQVKARDQDDHGTNGGTGRCRDDSMHLGEYQVKMQGHGRKSRALPDGKGSPNKSLVVHRNIPHGFSAIGFLTGRWRESHADC